MKKYILVLFLIITAANFSYGQPSAPPGFENCDDCEDLAELPEQYENCLAYFNCNTVPIDSNILVLFGTAILLGGYVMIKNKNKWVKN